MGKKKKIYQKFSGGQWLELHAFNDKAGRVPAHPSSGFLQTLGHTPSPTPHTNQISEIFQYVININSTEICHNFYLFILQFLKLSL